MKKNSPYKNRIKAFYINAKNRIKDDEEDLEPPRTQEQEEDIDVEGP